MTSSLKFRKLPSSKGTWPASSLSQRCNLLNSARSPISEGILPDNPFEFRSRSVTRSSPSVSTPCHSPIGRSLSQLPFSFQFGPSVERYSEIKTARSGEGVGVGVAVGIGVRVGAGVAVGTGVGTGVSVGSGVGTGVSVGSGVGTGVSVGSGVGAGVSVGSGVGAGVSVGTGVGTGECVGSGVGAGVAVGSGEGAGTSVGTGTGEGVSGMVVAVGAGDGSTCDLQAANDAAKTNVSRTISDA